VLETDVPLPGLTPLDVSLLENTKTQIDSLQSQIAEANAWSDQVESDLYDPELIAELGSKAKGIGDQVAYIEELAGELGWDGDAHLSKCAEQGSPVDGLAGIQIEVDCILDVANLMRTAYDTIEDYQAVAGLESYHCFIAPNDETLLPIDAEYRYMGPCRRVLAVQSGQLRATLQSAVKQEVRVYLDGLWRWMEQAQDERTATFLTETIWQVYQDLLDIAPANARVEMERVMSQSIFSATKAGLNAYDSPAAEERERHGSDSSGRFSGLRRHWDTVKYRLGSLLLHRSANPPGDRLQSTVTPKPASQDELDPGFKA
jgi:hypothetical protein